MKRVSHGNRSKPCSRSGRVEGRQRSEVLEPAEANRRAATKVNPIEPRNANLRVASESNVLKPAPLQRTTRTCKGLSGVVGGSAAGQWGWELGRALGARGARAL